MTTVAVSALTWPRAMPSTSAELTSSMLPDGHVARPRLAERLADSCGPPVALIAAPAGYGKTLLLGEWESREARPFVRLALVDTDNDAPVLRSKLARAREKLGAERPFVLALDDVQRLSSPGALALLRDLAESIPSGSRLALSTRVEPALPIGRLRAHRALLEVRARDLAMTAEEAGRLMDGAGLRLSPRSLAVLVDRTEGWPVGLYLAAIGLLDQADSAAAAASFRGDDATVADYLRDVALTGLTAGELAFLRRASVLDELSGDVCDAVLARSGSALDLERIGRINLLVGPVGQGCERYRCHPLLTDMLRTELRRREPETEAALRRRAAEWYVAHGDPDRAIGQAIAARATARAAELVWANTVAHASKGQIEAVRGWLARFSDEEIAAHSLLTLAAGLSHLVSGELDDVGRWEATARETLGQRQAGSEQRALEAGVALMHAGAAGDGLASMGEDAGRAFLLWPEDSGWRSYCRFLAGAAEHLAGDAAVAERLLEDGARRGAVVAPHAHALCLAQLALVAADREDWDGGAALAVRARLQVDHYALGDYPTAALVFATAGFFSARRGRVDRARADVRRADQLLERLGPFTPWYEAETLVALARAELRLGDVPRARSRLADAKRSARRIPEAGVLDGWIAAAGATIDGASAASLVGPAMLTAAELRVLGFMPTHLSFPEIAARLYVSVNTIKTQAHAVYRKLDASSRSQAVATAMQLGLLEG